MSFTLVTLHKDILADEERKLNEVTIDTGSNRKRSFINQQQYIRYQEEFGIKFPTRSTENTGLWGIGGLRAVIEEVFIQIPFSKIGIIIEVDFAIMKE